MTGSTILVLGGTGPAGICLIRELVFRNHATIVYARNPSKIPKELASNALLEVIKGEIDDHDNLSSCVARCSAVISLLGPNLKNRNIKPTMFADYYRSSVIPLMRQHGVRCILAMGTISIKRPEDRFSFFHWIVQIFMRLFANALYRNMLNIADTFVNEAEGLDWTVFRLAAIPGESDETSWKRDRRDGELYTGWVGENGWTSSLKRGALARWLVDTAESVPGIWVRKMPAVSKLAR